MKNLLLYVTVCLLATLASCGKSETGGVRFENLTLQQALDKAGEENKLVFVDAHTSWCIPCRRMDHEVFPQKKVGDYMNATFVNVRFDMEKGEGLEIAEKYGVTRYPTFLVLAPDGTPVGTEVGGSRADKFLERIKEVVNLRPAPAQDADPTPGGSNPDMAE